MWKFEYFIVNIIEEDCNRNPPLIVCRFIKICHFLIVQKKYGNVSPNDIKTNYICT
jgi:hypothetical protein